MDKYLTAKEVAKMLNVSTETVRRWCAERTIKAFRVGRKWNIPAEQLDNITDNYS